MIRVRKDEQNEKIVSLFLSALLICTISVPVLAVNEEREIPVNQESGITDITQFSYIVIDKEGNIKSSGITPNFDSKGYNWSGITLDNGDRVVFRKPDGSNFYCLKGQEIIYSLVKDVGGLTRIEFLNTSDNLDSGGISIYIEDTSSIYYGDSFIIPETPAIVGSPYYCLAITNASSQVVTIKSLILIF